MSDVDFTAPAVDDLRRIGPDAVPKVLKKVLLLLDNPEAGYPLGGELTGFRKLVVGRNLAPSPITFMSTYRLPESRFRIGSRIV